MKIFRVKYSLFSYMLRNMIIAVILITVVSIVAMSSLFYLLVAKNSDFVSSPFNEFQGLILNEEYSRIYPEKSLGPSSYFCVLNDNYDLIYISNSEEQVVYSKEELTFLPSEEKANLMNVEFFFDEEKKEMTRVEINDKKKEYTIISEDFKVVYSNKLKTGMQLNEAVYECFIGRNNEFYMTKNDYITNAGINRHIIFFNHIDEMDTSVGRVLEILFIEIITVLIIIIIGSCIYLYHLNRKVILPMNVIGQAIQNFDINQDTFKIAYQGLREFTEMVDQLDIMFKKLKRYEGEKNMYIANISHDIKTPLSVIKGYSLSLYNNLVKPENQKKILLDISKQSDDIAELINNLGYYAQLNSNELAMKFEEHNISDFFKNYIIDEYASLELQGVIINPDIEEENKICLIDSFQMKRVFKNIIDNSVKYNDKGIEIFLSLYFSDGEAIIRFADNGRGINLALRETLFEAFVTSNYTRKAGKGTGLGMAIVESIIALHKGSIKLLSIEESQYSVEYEIRLPITKAHKYLKD